MEARSPALTKNFDGNRPEIATCSRAAFVAVADRRNEDDRSDRLVLVASALVLAFANAQETRRRFQPAADRERNGFAFGDDDAHDQDPLAPLFDDEPGLGRLEGDERHG